jgi:hypothetical protein
MKKLIYKNMLNAGWSRDDANDLMKAIDKRLEDGEKITSSNLDPLGVSVKFDSGAKITIKMKVVVE